MATCSCLKLCSVVVAIANVSFGIYIMVLGGYEIQDYLDSTTSIGSVIVYFQISSSLIFVGLLLLIGIIKEKEKLVSLYLLLSSLIWFIISMLAVSYMLFYNTTQNSRYYLSQTTTTTMSTLMNSTMTTPPPVPKAKVPEGKAAGYSIGLVLIWCGQLGVYKFHDQVIEKYMIDAGQSYVSSANRTN